LSSRGFALCSVLKKKGERFACPSASGQEKPAAISGESGGFCKSADQLKIPLFIGSGIDYFTQRQWSLPFRSSGGTAFGANDSYQTN
jgi:hypothetical protein